MEFLCFILRALKFLCYMHHNVIIYPRVGRVYEALISACFCARYGSSTFRLCFKGEIRSTKQLD